MRLYIATANPNKVKEITRFLESAKLNIEVFSSDTIGGLPEVYESGATFPANALIKAKALLPLVPPGCWVMSDDSGLEVDALNGKPGVHSARYAGSNATDVDNNRKLLAELSDVTGAGRAARFCCSIALLGPEDREQYFMGKCEGRIVNQPRGSCGFGYDPLFLPDGYDKTFAELGPSVKDTESHRARALTGLVDWLKLQI